MGHTTRTDCLGSALAESKLQRGGAGSLRGFRVAYHLPQRETSNDSTVRFLMCRTTATYTTNEPSINPRTAMLCGLILQYLLCSSSENICTMRPMIRCSGAHLSLYADVSVLILQTVKLPLTLK